MPWQELTGYLAGLCTSLSVIPQISKAWRTRAVEDISLFTLGVLLSGLALWTFYGFVKDSWPIILTNAVAFALNLFLLGLVLRKKPKP